MNKTNDSKNKLIPYDESGQSKSQLLSKKDLLGLVRKTNPAELNVAPSSFWSVEESLKTGSIDDSNLKQQLNIIESGVLYSAKLYNDIKVKNDMLAKTLKKKLANLDEQRRNFENLNAMKQAETTESKRIQELQREATNVEIEIVKLTHYSRQLDHIMLRLKTNQLKFDAHMGLMENTMPAITREQEEVAHLKRCLMVGLGKASLVLDQTKQALSRAKRDRAHLMAKRLEEMKNAEMLQEWMEKRKEAKLNLALELRGDLTKEEERFLTDQINAKVEETKRLQKENEESTKLLYETETFFAKLKQITGVTSLENMAEKFSLQKISKIDLEKEVSEVERKLAHAKKELLYQEKAFSDLKSTGANQVDLSRSASDKLTQDIEKARGDFKLSKASNARLATILLELQQSSNGLLQRLLPFSDLTELDTNSVHSNNNSQNITDMMNNTANTTTSYNSGVTNSNGNLATTIEALNQSEAILAKMLEIVTNGTDNNNIASVVNNSINGLSSFSASSYPFASEDDNDHMNDSSNNGIAGNTSGNINVRVKSKKMKRSDDLTVEMSGLGQKVGGNNSNTLNGKSDKSATSNALLSSSMIAGNKSTLGGIPKNTSTPSTPNNKPSSSLVSMRKHGLHASGSENEIASRELVKSRSERRLTEEIQRIRREKKKEKLLQQQSNRKHTLAAVKAKQMAEAINSSKGGGGDASDKKPGTANVSQKAGATGGGGTVAGLIEDDDDGKLAADLEFKMMAMNLIAKEQQEYCQRLTGTTKLMADGVNVRADVMTKVKTFFDRKPELE